GHISADQRRGSPFPAPASARPLPEASLPFTNMSRSASLGAPGEARSVLAIKPFRRLWISLSLSGLGDWLSLLAMVSLAVALTRAAAPAVDRKSVVYGTW